MKTINYLFLALVAVLSFGSCKKDKESFEEKLLVGTEFLEVSSKSETYNFDVLSNLQIQVEADANWIQLDTIAYDKGKHKVRFSVHKNEDDERTGTIYVRLGTSQEREVLVVQESGKVPVFYVKEDGKGDGKSWSSATDLTNALEKATTNSIIYIAAGTYSPTKTIRNGDQTEESDKTIEISKNITLLGGFDKNAQVGAKPNAKLYKTIFDGTLASGKSAFHTVVISAPYDAEASVTLEGITITGGNATDRSTNTTINGVKYSRGQGGGLLVANAVVNLRKVAIINNRTSTDKGTAGYAAGVYAFAGAKLHLEEVNIDNNSGVNNGGGIWLSEASMTAHSSTFNNNSAKGTAGGVHGYPNAMITLYNCEVLGNSNTSYGAGVYMRDNSTVILVNCFLTGNKSTSANGGGAVMLYDASNAHIISSTIINNEVVGPGGGVYRRSKSNNLSIYNSIISGNKQASSSTDVDAHADNASIVPTIKNSVINIAVFGDQGTTIVGQSFVPSLMLNADFLPIGPGNPAHNYGLDGAALQSLGGTFNPGLHDAVKADFSGVVRATKHMGYKIN